MEDDDIRYRALCANDPRVDGLFFVGIKTTEIYCRSLCPARRALRKNCTFYSSAAAAEDAGYRPCLRCRPELAPMCSPYEARFEKAAAIIAQIQGGALNGTSSITALAARHDLSVRQLRRVVKQASGVTPVQLAQTSRLLLAKQLLTESDLPITDVAFASGFASLRRFNELFAASYRMPPSRFRKTPKSSAHSVADGALMLRLDYRPPFAWDALLDFLKPRAIAGVEFIDAGRYHRTFELREHRGTFEARLAESGEALAVRISVGLAPVLQTLLAHVRDLFDLHARPSQIDEFLGRFDRLAPLVQARPGLRVPGTVNGFELAWRAILGQQVTVAGATTLAGRLAAKFGEPLESADPNLTHFTPTAIRVAKASAKEICSIGLPLKRAESIRALAGLCVRDPQLLSPGSSPHLVKSKLQALAGIGPWTAEYVVMRALRWPDAFLASDLGIKKALQVDTPSASENLAKDWSPWRSYAGLHLWASLSGAASRDIKPVALKKNRATTGRRNVRTTQSNKAKAKELT